MRNKKQLPKRALAMLLSLLILVTNVGVLPIYATETEGHTHESIDLDGKWSGTTGQLVANNYDQLNDYEKAILACTGLVGDTYVVDVPTNENEGLVSVNADAQTVTAVPYESDGYTWTPGKAVVKYTNPDGTPGTDIEVSLKEVGGKYVGSFNKPANSYRVEVTYSLYIAVAEDLQRLLLNIPAYLVNGYEGVDAAASLLGLPAEELGVKMEDLRQLYNGINYTVENNGEVVASYTLALPDGAVKSAVGELLADYDKNGGELTLARYCDDFYSAASQVEFILEQGEEFYNHIAWFRDTIDAIYGGRSELEALADQLDHLANGTGDGSIEGYKATIDAMLEQEIADGYKLLDKTINDEAIKPAIEKADSLSVELSEILPGAKIDLSSLDGKTRNTSPTIFEAIETERQEIEALAQQIIDEAEELAHFYEQIGQIKPAENVRAEAKANADKLRENGIGALDKLEDGIVEAYAEADALVAEARTQAEAKKAELDALSDTAETKAAEIRQVVKLLPEIRRTVNRAVGDPWDFIGKKLVKDSITAEEYKALDKAVIEAWDSGEDFNLHDDFEIKSELFATSTVISAMVDQYVVYVEVKGNVIPKNSVDSAATVALDVFSDNFPMDKDTAAADILAAIKAKGTENRALQAWDSYYNVGETYYDRVVTITDANGAVMSELGDLVGNVTYTITYVPKNFNINETYDARITAVPYGYNWRLPRPLDTTKSYEYKVNGKAYRENTIVRIVEDIEVTRGEGKAIDAKSLAEVIASSKTPGSDLSDKEKVILKTGALKVDTLYFRTPDSNDKLTAIKSQGAGYVLTAQPMHAGLMGYDNAAWVPVSAYPVLENGNGASFALSEESDGSYSAYFECDELFERVEVLYQLQIPGLDAATVSELVNIAYTLSEDMKLQKLALDNLCNKNNFYANLGRVNRTLLGTITGQVTLSPAAKAALDEMMNLAMGEKQTYLYEYLTQYMSENGGMAYYYQSRNAENIQKQIDLVNKNLPIIWNDPAVQQALIDMDMQSEGSRVEIILDQLASVNLKPINALVNTDSEYINNLVDAVMNGAGTVSNHGAVSGDVVLEQTLSAAAPGQAAYGITIQVLNKNDGVVETYAAEKFAKVGSDISKATLEAMYNELLATIPNKQYYVPSIELPEDGIKLETENEAVILTGTMKPVTYTVKIDGEADQTLYAFDAYTIILPGTGSNGFKYIYSIGNNQVEVNTGAISYPLGKSPADLDALFDANRELVITRELVDVNKANFLQFIENFNVALSNAGLVEGNNLALAFIPVTDNDGNLSVVLRVNNQFGALSPQSLAAEMMGLVMDLSYVGLNDSPLFGLDSNNELKLYVQTFINMMLNSGLGMDTLTEIIDINGDIKELKLSGVATAADSIVLPNGKVIPNAQALGGKLMESTMQFGVNIDNCVSVPFYVTYQDFDTQRAELAKARKGVSQILPYFNLSMRNGSLNTMLNLPDTAYAYLMTSMLAIGQVDFSTLQTYDLAGMLEYLFGTYAPMFDHDNISADTLINTIKQTGFYDAIDGFDLNAHKALINLIYNSIDHLHDSIDRQGSSVEGLYTGTLSYDALDVLLNQNVMLGDFSNMVAEKDSGVEMPVTFYLKNREAEYQALVLDVRADGILNKYTMSRKAVDAVKKASDDAIVILLSDVRGDLVFNNDVLLNLNGYSVNGNMVAKGNVVIVDSTLDTYKAGNVTGKMITDGGSYRIAAGKYLDDVTAYLDEGYYYIDNVVSNGCYTMVKNGDDLDIYLNTDYAMLNKSAGLTMTVDLLAKLLMNYYGVCTLAVDGNTLYEVAVQNITEDMNDLSVLLSKFVKCFDYVGSSAFATQFMQDVTDFGALADAIENGTPIISYSLLNAAFNPYLDYEANGDYFTLNVGASENKQITNINVLLADEVPAHLKNKAVAILREMDNITTFNALSVSIDKLNVGGNGFSIDGSAMADLEVDLTTNVNYPVILAALLANDATGAYRTKLIDAIVDYQTTYSTIELKKALENMSIAQLASALENSRSKSFSSILSGLGITAPGAVELESLYTVLRKVAGTMIHIADVNGTSNTLGGLKLAEFGTYGYSIKKSNDVYASFVLRLFTEEKPITVKDKNGIIVANSDDLAQVLKTVKKGYTVYVNAPVTLDASVTLPGVAFTLEKADNINFNGNTLWFNNGNTVLTTDVDLSAYVDSDDSLFCSEVTCEKNGEWYIFRLDGEAHEWEEIPAVQPSCEEVGYTAGTKCKYCGKYEVEPVEIPATGHDYSAVVTPPTCVDQGYTTYTCTVCGDTYIGNYVDKTGHTVEVVPGYEATCTTDGLTNGSKCSVCGITLDAQALIPATGHTKKVVPGYAATCSKEGLTDGEICAVCGVILKPQIVIAKDPTAHNPVDNNYVKEPTCCEPGISGGTICADCGAEIAPGTLIPVDPNAHHEVPFTKVPTCTETGIENGIMCDLCGKVLAGDVVGKKPHTSEVVKGYEATCTAPGLTDGTQCSVCGYWIMPQTIIPAKGHTYETVVTPPTCEDKGYTTYTCKVCGYSYVDNYVDALNHPAYAREEIPAVPADCYNTGLTAGEKCTLCGEITKAQEIVPVTHTPKDVPVKPATCTEDGLTGATECAICGVALEPGTPIPALHHPVTEREEIKGYDATCTEDGLTDGEKCKLCGEIVTPQVPIPAKGHTYETEVTAPTCVDKGYTTYTCACGDSYVSDYVDALGHGIALDDQVNATCTEDGLTARVYCPTCGYVHIEAQRIPAGHTALVLPDKEATCTEDGLRGAVVCDVCHEKLNPGVVVPALGHPTTDIIPGVPADCDSNGLTDGLKCTICNVIVKDQEIILAHHTFVDYEKEPTCTEPGWVEGKQCSVCGYISDEDGEKVPAKGHGEYVPIPGEPATCTTTGLKDGYRCSVCGVIVVPQEIIPIKGHSYNAVVTAPTCTEMGYTTHTCTVCGDSYVDSYVVSTGHGVKVIEGKPATCTEDGTTYSVICPTCNFVHVPEQVITALGHNVVIDPAVAPSCTISGKTEGSHCDRCEVILVPQVDIPVVEHVAVIDPAVDATETTEGKTKGSHCANCGKILVEQQTVAKLPYIHVPTVSLENKEIIGGGKVDAEGRYIYLDSAPTGLKVTDFSNVNFVIDNATSSTITITKGNVVRGENDLVCTGDLVTVVATNENGAQATVSYTIIIMGDANCDGKLNARDTALMKAAFVGELTLEGDGALAADMNFDGKLNARDTAACDSKFVNWNDGYNSLTK